MKPVVQWGSVDYHKQSLRNLQRASQQTKRMCAVILDTVGRELLIRRDLTLDHEVGASHQFQHTSQPLCHSIAAAPCHALMPMKRHCIPVSATWQTSCANAHIACLWNLWQRSVSHTSQSNQAKGRLNKAWYR